MWNDRVIVWLDYDGRLDASMLADVDTVCMRARSSSFVIVTCNSQPAQLEREEELRKRVEDKVPVGTTEASLANWGSARTNREILTGQIEATLRDRADEFRYRQVFNFQYDDGAKMLTVGGVVYKADDEGTVEACEFDDFDFVELGQDPFNITAPRLTLREMQHLEAQLPADDSAGWTLTESPLMTLIGSESCIAISLVCGRKHVSGLLRPGPRFAVLQSLIAERNAHERLHQSLRGDP